MKTFFEVDVGDILAGPKECEVRTLTVKQNTIIKSIVKTLQFWVAKHLS